MKTQIARKLAPKLAASALLSLCLLSANAMANDAVIGALLGGGAGAIVGQSIGGRNATIIGGAIGAAAGAAIGSDNGRTTYVERRVEYIPPPPVYYSQPVRVVPGPMVYGSPVRVIETPVYYVKDRHHRHSHGRDWREDDRHFDERYVYDYRR